MAATARTRPCAAWGENVAEQSTRQEKYQKRIDGVDSEVRCLEDERVKGGKIVVERKTQLGNGATGKTGMAAKHGGADGVEGKLLHPDTLCEQDIGLVVEEKVPVQASPIDGDQYQREEKNTQYGHTARQSRNRQS